MRYILRRRHLKRIIVTLKSGNAFAGVLWQHDRDALVLLHGVALKAGPNKEDVAADGETILFRSEIDYVQRP